MKDIASAIVVVAKLLFIAGMVYYFKSPTPLWLILLLM